MTYIYKILHYNLCE